MDESLIGEDFEAFPQAPPPTEQELKAMQKKRAAEEKAAKPKGVTAAQIKAVKEMSAADRHAEELPLKQDLVRRIKQYHAKFGSQIGTKLPRGFGVKNSLEDLQQLMHDIELDVNSASAQHTAVALFAGAFQGFQQLTQLYNPLDLRLSGPRADLVSTLQAQQSTWMPMIEEFAIKYEKWFAVGVEKRLLFYAAGVILLVNKANKEAPAMDEAAAAPAEPDVLERMGELFNELT